MEEGEVRIRLSVSGVDVEVECRHDQVEDVVQDVLRGLKHTSEGMDRSRAAPKGREIPTTCKEVIEQLWKEGWMAKPRALGDVYDEMSRRGYHYDRSAVSHALLDLVKEGKLSRRGKPRKYRYVQKAPVDQVINVEST